MGLFKEIAEPLVARGVPVIPLRPRTKVAFLTGWETLATTDQTKITEWDQDYVEANGACVAYARPDGVWFLEIDKEGFAAEIEKQTGQKIPTTFMVRSSPGRGHYYFRQTAASIAMGNAQGKDNEGKESWSARVDNRYVVAPGSYHPTSGRKYEILRNAEIVPAPDWLVQWCVANAKPATEKTGHAELDSEDIIAEGGRNNALTSILGKARQVLKMDREQLFVFGLDINQKRCRPPMPDSEVRTIANSVAGYAVKESGQLVFSHPDQVTNNGAPEEAVSPAQVKRVPYPVFPRWVMDGTSIGEGLVKPVCSVNSRYPEYMFMPAMTLVLNYLALKVNVEGKLLIPSFFMISIGRKGRVIKSSSAQDAMEYLQQAGIVEHGSSGTKNAGGKTLVWTPGSTEGLGLEMTRTNNKNAVLYYDELSTLTNKASIEGSSLGSTLLSLYEAGKFSNTIKSRKESYNFDPRSYCASLIACTTDKNFHAQWSKMSGGSSGLDERFFFLYQPETLIDLTPYKMVTTVEAAQNTRKLIEKAVMQKTYRFSDETMLEMNINRLGNRVENRVEKMALFFAVDLGRDEIDEGCIERALAIANYELGVKKYLAAFESTTKEGALQGEIIQLLQRNGGAVTTRELDRALHPERHGTFLWSRVYGGLINAGWIAETGTGRKGDPKQIVLMRLPEEDE